MSNVSTFNGRIILAHDDVGEAAVTRSGFNATAAFMEVLFQGSDSAVCQDHDNRDLFGVDLQDKILCVPQTIGSSAAAPQSSLPGPVVGPGRGRYARGWAGVHPCSQSSSPVTKGFVVRSRPMVVSGPCSASARHEPAIEPGPSLLRGSWLQLTSRFSSGVPPLAERPSRPSWVKETRLSAFSVKP